MRKPATPLQAIKKKCLECSGGDRKEAEACELKKCPLHPYRLGVDIAASMLKTPPAPEKAKEQAPRAKQLTLF
jgi:hypothetical protein